MEKDSEEIIEDKNEIIEKVKKIEELKKEKQVTLLAHYYQTLEVHKVADRVGDSLGLSKIAKNEVDTPYILFAGVTFMAETASILNQEKTVLLPNKKEAICPLADYLDEKTILEYKSRYPNAPLIVYVNTTAEAKAHADVCCTSSNSVKICKKTAEKWDTNEILFGPDRNLATYVRKQTDDIDLITVPQDGNCPYHNLFTVQDVERIKAAHPDAVLLVHPESPPEVQDRADVVGSTAQMRKYVENNEIPFGAIIGTEIGLLEFLKDKMPEKKFYPLSKNSICKGMKALDLDNIIEALEAIGTEKESDFEIRVPKELAEKAEVSINRMIEFS